MAVAAMAVAGVLSVSGCTKGVKDDIKKLGRRVSALEDITSTLDEHHRQGAMIRSVSPLPGDAGWRIEFIGNSRTNPDPIEIYHGHNGNGAVTPRLDVRTNPDGTVSVWYNTTPDYPDDGWTDTGTNLRAGWGNGGGQAGPAGPQGPQGPQGLQGPAGNDADLADLQFRVAENEAGRLYVWYAVVPDPTEQDWIPIVPADNAGPIAGIVDNDNGTATIIMNDVSPSNPVATNYTFYKYSTADHIEIMRVDAGPVAVGSSFEVVFRVNPSPAVVPLDPDRWVLDLVTTRASYVMETLLFTLDGIVPDGDKTGQFVATITFNGPGDPAVANYVLAIVMKTGVGSDTNPVDKLVTSSPFVVNCVFGPPEPNYPGGDVPALGDPIYGERVSEIPGTGARYAIDIAENMIVISQESQFFTYTLEIENLTWESIEPYPDTTLTAPVEFRGARGYRVTGTATAADCSGNSIDSFPIVGAEHTLTVYINEAGNILVVMGFGTGSSYGIPGHVWVI